MRIIPDTAVGYTSADALAFCGGVCQNEAPDFLASALPPITTDSREVERGDLFIALRGENFDGHAFIPSVIERGAACVICECIPDNIASDCVFFKVKDTLVALGDIASGYLRKLSPEIIAAVTGSVGKTTTKEYLASLLSVKYNTHKTEGNFNNLIGLPLTVLSAPADTEALVLEMGMSARGEIARLSEIARPNIAIITAIGTSHIEHLGSRENICLAKCEVLEFLQKGARVYVPDGEPLLDRVQGDRFDTVRVSPTPSPRCRIGAENIESVGFFTRADIVGGGIKYTALTFPTLGIHCLADAMLAIEAVRDLGFTEREIREGLLAYRPAGMRQRIREVGGVTLIEDCYNASPESMRASLDVLAALSTSDCKVKAALLGDMYELGECSRELHYKVGEYAAGKLDMLFTLGERAQAIAEGARAAGMPPERIFRFDDISLHAECGHCIAELIGDGAVLLAKASRATAAEKAITAFEEAYRH